MTSVAAPAKAGAPEGAPANKAPALARRSLQAPGDLPAAKGTPFAARRRALSQNDLIYEVAGAPWPGLILSALSLPGAPANAGAPEAGDLAPPALLR